MRNAKPLEKAYKMHDGDGLYLIVPPGGGKQWRMKYRFRGQEKQMTIGSFPAISVKAARAATRSASFSTTVLTSR